MESALCFLTLSPVLWALISESYTLSMGPPESSPSEEDRACPRRKEERGAGC